MARHKVWKDQPSYKQTIYMRNFHLNLHKCSQNQDVFYFKNSILTPVP